MPKQLEKLAKKIMKRYIEKGYSENKAKQIGYATANKLLNERKNKNGRRDK